MEEKEFHSRQFLAEAWRHSTNGRTAEALELLSRSVAENPGFYPAYVQRGYVYCTEILPGLAITAAQKPEIVEFRPSRQLWPSGLTL